ncbi:MAG: response regulator [Pirellulales bacterium]
MKRILFVDDEQQILDAMKNMLRKRRKEWDMVFVASGAAALEEMEKSSFDVIVTDMRMPVMDGAELLEQVCQRFPRTARFVLSGQANSDSILRVLPFSQQFLSKPCDPEELNRVINQTCALQSNLADDAVRDFVGGVRMLPSTVPSMESLKAAIQEPEVPLTSVTEIIMQDPAATAKILQLVNSAYYGLSRRVPTIQQAVSLMGTELLQSICSVRDVFSSFETRPELQGMTNLIQQHSLQAARLAAKFVSNNDPSFVDRVYTAGLLHDIGALGLAKMQSERYREIIQLAELTRKRLIDVETELKMVPHSLVGGYLLGVWGLPPEIVDCAMYHHNPSACPSGETDILWAVHAADAIADAGSHPGLELTAFLDLEGLEQAGLSHQIDRWTNIYLQSLDEIKRPVESNP